MIMQQILNKDLTKAREIYDSIKDSIHVPAKCVEILTDRGISTKSGKPWTQHIIRAVLRGDYHDERVLLAVIEVGEKYIEERVRVSSDLQKRGNGVLRGLKKSIAA